MIPQVARPVCPSVRGTLRGKIELPTACCNRRGEVSPAHLGTGYGSTTGRPSCTEPSSPSTARSSARIRSRTQSWTRRRAEVSPEPFAPSRRAGRISAGYASVCSPLVIHARDGAIPPLSAGPGPGSCIDRSSEEGVAPAETILSRYFVHMSPPLTRSHFMSWGRSGWLSRADVPRRLRPARAADRGARHGRHGTSPAPASARTARPPPGNVTPPQAACRRGPRSGAVAGARAFFAPPRARRPRARRRRGPRPRPARRPGRPRSPVARRAERQIVRAS